MTKIFVIDACVPSAASTKDYPVSSMSRVFLDSLIKTDYKICLNKKLKKEWMEHRSVYTVKVLSSLKSRNRILELDGTHVKVDYIRENIEIIRDIGRREPILKDLHLIDAALFCDKFIISLDKTAKNNFCEIMDRFPILEGILWVNPTKTEEEPIKWLLDGANYEPKRTLKSYAPRKLMTEK